MPRDNPRSGCLFALARVLGFSPPKSPGLPYIGRESLLSPAERSFYGVLCQAIDGRHVIFAKVRLADMVAVSRGADGWQSHFNRISAKHVDFVLCDRETVRPVLAIELDDSSHGRDRRRERDGFLDDVLQTAGLPILRIRAARGYSVADVRLQIGESLS